MEDLQMRLKLESDYKAEAAIQRKSRSLVQEADGIVVPEVYPNFSTERVLTMERLDGVHLPEFLKTNPSQEQRNEAARKIARAWYRLLYAGRMVYADIHPGNFLFLKDGRLGLLDFGFMVLLDDELWALFSRMDRALTTGRREDRIAILKEWSWITDDVNDRERLQLSEEFADWSWRPRYCRGEFDFGDETDFRRGVALFSQMVAKRYSRSRPCTPVMARHQFGLRAMVYRLQAKFDVRPICEEEVKLSGWDRSA
jgi:aarF domain-containing kinase